MARMAFTLQEKLFIAVYEYECMAYLRGKNRYCHFMLLTRKPKVQLWRIELRNFPYFRKTKQNKHNTTQKSNKIIFAITSKLKLHFPFLGNGKCLCNNLRRDKEEERARERSLIFENTFYMKEP